METQNLLRHAPVGVELPRFSSYLQVVDSRSPFDERSFPSSLRLEFAILSFHGAIFFKIISVHHCMQPGFQISHFIFVLCYESSPQVEVS